MQIYDLFSGLKWKLKGILFRDTKASHVNAYEGQSCCTAHMCECIHENSYTSCFANIGYFSMCRQEVCTINTACNNLMVIGKWLINKLGLDRQWLLMTLPLFKQSNCDKFENKMVSFNGKCRTSSQDCGVMWELEHELRIFMNAA